MRTEESEQNKSSSTKSTTKSCKRELSSPIQQDLQIKKYRSKPSSDSDSITELNETATELSNSNEDMQESESDAQNQEGVATYYLSRPMVPDDVCNIAQELKTLMLPEVRATVKDEIKEELAGFGSMLDKAVASINKTLNDQIGALKTENKELKTKVSKLESQANSYEKRATKAEKAIDALEQYSRRNSVRISGIKEPQQLTDAHETQSEDTDYIALNMANDMGVNLDPRDIDRSHRAGKKSAKGRCILVKFATYRARQAFLGNRKKLKAIDKWKDVFISEDLTKKRSEILYHARQLVKQNKLNAAFSLDGRIFIKDSEDKRHQVESKEVLIAYGASFESREGPINSHEPGPEPEAMDSASAW